MVDGLFALLINILVIIFVLIAVGTWIYILCVSFKDGCIWPLVIFFLPFFGFLIYVIGVYDGKKGTVLICYFLPSILGAILRILF
ncbi:MAG: hypothetical protein AB1782_01285 [Cyanobacteriota bacterium]